MSLKHLEKQIILKKFGDPRVHFASSFQEEPKLGSWITTGA